MCCGQIAQQPTNNSGEKWPAGKQQASMLPVCLYAVWLDRPNVYHQTTLTSCFQQKQPPDFYLANLATCRICKASMILLLLSQSLESLSSRGEHFLYMSWNSLTLGWVINKPMLHIELIQLFRFRCCPTTQRQRCRASQHKSRHVTSDTSKPHS